MTVSFDYYSAVYMGEEIPECEFNRYLTRAEGVVRMLTKGKSDNIASYPVGIQESVKQAICAQIEYLFMDGIDIATSGRQNGGFTVGKVTIHGSGNDGKSGAASMVAPAVYLYLETTGLLDPAVPTADRPFLWW